MDKTLAEIPREGIVRKDPRLQDVRFRRNFYRLHLSHPNVGLRHVRKIDVLVEFSALGVVIPSESFGERKVLDEEKKQMLKRYPKFELYTVQATTNGLTYLLIYKPHIKRILAGLLKYAALYVYSFFDLGFLETLIRKIDPERVLFHNRIVSLQEYRKDRDFLADLSVFGLTIRRTLILSDNPDT